MSVKTYSAELMIYDRRHRCLLTEADYELVLEEDVSPKLASHKQRTWETVTDGKVGIGRFVFCDFLFCIFVNFGFSVGTLGFVFTLGWSALINYIITDTFICCAVNFNYQNMIASVVEFGLVVVWLPVGWL